MGKQCAWIWDTRNTYLSSAAASCSSSRTHLCKLLVAALSARRVAASFANMRFSKLTFSASRDASAAAVFAVKSATSWSPRGDDPGVPL